MSNTVWSTIWGYVYTSITSAIDVMKSIIVSDGSVRVSLFHIAFGVVIMGAIINLFINFTTPTLPDETISSRKERLANKKYRQDKRADYYKKKRKGK